MNDQRMPWRPTVAGAWAVAVFGGAGLAVLGLLALVVSVVSSLWARWYQRGGS